MKLVDLENIYGVMVKNMKEHGLTIKCMVKVSFGGQMEKNILVNF